MPTPTLNITETSRVHFGGMTAFPRYADEEKTKVKFYSCVSPVKDLEGFDTLTVGCDVAGEDGLDNVRKLEEAGLVMLSDLKITIEEYEDDDGETQYRAHTTQGVVNIRGDW